MFSSILVPVELTQPERAIRCVEVARELARDHDAMLTLATILPHAITIRDVDHSWEARRWFEARARAGLARLRAEHADGRCRTLSRWGSVHGATLDIAEEIGADVVIMAVRKPSFFDLFRPQSAFALAKKCKCSVVLVR